MTIIDANVTTLIVAVTLYMMGSGPVRGFAVTLGLGIACRYMRILSRRIEFENREGGGTIVAVHLPLWEPQ